MIVPIEQGKVDEANLALKSLLEGAQLDSFTVHSVELSICFFRPPVPQVWLSTLQCVSLSKSTGKPIESLAVQDNRRELLGELYDMIGEEVSRIGVATSGALEVQFCGGAGLSIVDFDEDEVLWSITSGSPVPFAHHDWAVSLLNPGELVVKTPKNPPVTQKAE